MKRLKVLAALSVTTSLLVGAPIAHAGRGAYAFNTNEVSQVAPAFMHYSHDVLCKLWERPELSPRDRSIVTLAALISSGFSSGFAIWKTRKMNFAVMTPCTENLS